MVEKHNLCFKRPRYNFNAEKIPILGVVVGWGEVQMGGEKVKAVKEWRTSTNIKKVENFL